MGTLLLKQCSMISTLLREGGVPWVITHHNTKLEQNTADTIDEVTS